MSLRTLHLFSSRATAACVIFAFTLFSLFFFFNDPPTPEIYPLPLHDALPISGLVTASAWSASRWNGPSDAATVKVRSPVTVRLAASVASCERQEARTSRAVTGAPSQNRALSRSVKAQRSPGACSQAAARLGSGRPRQSTRINDS